MIRFVERYFKVNDARGAIEGLINFGSWEEVNYITSTAGCIRGNHYHRETLEAFFILTGCIRIDVQEVKNGKLLGAMERFEVAAGDVFVIQPNTNHTFHVLEEASWMNFLSRKMDGKAPDFHRP